MAQTGALATQAPAVAEREFRCVCIDIETPATGEAVLHKLAAFRSDSDQHALFQGQFRPEDVRVALESLAEGADFVLGHNVRRHDLPVLVGLYPGLSLAQLPVVDTLELSPIAFPENPYHRLVKDYKLVSDARNHPMRDAELALELFQQELAAFQSLQTTHPHDVALFHYLLGGAGLGGVASLFMMVRRAVRPRTAEAAVHLTKAIGEKVCATRLRSLVEKDLSTPSLQYSLSYLAAWLRVAGGNSVLPRWVVHTFPGTTRVIRELRDTPCDAADCAYCQTTHNPEAQLSQYFSLSEFRPQPENDTGGSLQRDVTVAGLRGENLLAILPTGAGKSLCYQLPALAHYWRTGKLTVVVSPLQSLMKDQVDNLVKRGIYCAVALNGLLTPPERRSVLDKIRMGDAGIVLVSPEQFRNKTFVDAIRWREIAAWVFDEAHCLSRWGHDFRTDYLYVATFIRERYGDRLPPVACFTATAKLDVIADLQQHFQAELGIDLTLYAGGHARPNLDYEVIPVTRPEKAGRVIELLREALPENSGGAVIFAATRKNAETLAELIAASGWACAYFHAGLPPGTKREIQQNFVSGSLRVIVATNAFGMGVDKPDVRLVVHADIPGSLENYLQEAGRAGRDSAGARCVLLYDEEDVEIQFSLSARSRLTHRDFIGVLKAIRKRKNRLGDVIVVTARELLLGEEDEIGFDVDDRDAETKVRTAIAWLERARLVRREENHTRVFSASLQVASLQEAEAKLLRADLSDETRERYRAVLRLIMDTSAADGITTDQIMAAAAIPANECFRTLHNLETLGLLANDLGLRVVLRRGVTDPSDARLARISHIERALVDVMAESAPDADGSSYQVLSLRPLCEGVRERLQGTLPPESIVPERLLDLLRAMAQSFGAGDSKRAILTLRKAGSSELRVRVQRPWSEIREITERRRAAAHLLLQTLLEKVPEGVRSADAIVECKAGELLKALTDDLEMAGQLRDPAAALEHALLYLHDTEVLILDRGRTVFRSAMTLKVLDREGGSRFLKEDYAPLERHYGERNFQIHVMHEYAKRGLRKVADALALVAAYFSWNRDRFIKEHFAGRKEILDLATTAESYQRIVEALRHPIQQQLVHAREGVNRLVLAGPGSGKTKVIVHRVAYLLRVLRVPPESIIVLTFNRSAAVEIRRRLRALIGGDAAGVTALTYHAMALRLTGISLGKLGQTDQQPDFDAVVRHAVDLLEGRVEAGTDPDDLRDRLLTGYRFILVDEYQDIDANQYDLVSALAGRTLKEGDTKLTIMAVGDDDQNIYSFRDTSVEFIRRFEADYEAQKSYLVENFRSTQHIISAANFVIQRAPERMKADHPIQINHTRSSSPPGGRWEALDPTARGHVQLIRFSLAEGGGTNDVSPAAGRGVPREGRGGGSLAEEEGWPGVQAWWEPRVPQREKVEGGWDEEKKIPSPLAGEGWGEGKMPSPPVGEGEGGFKGEGGFTGEEKQRPPLPPGEGWGEGSALVTRNIQAQLAMLELWRLRQLDPTADWSHFAILARTHAALEPIRAYCELNDIPYRTGDRELGLSATRTREGDLVLSTLRRKSGRMIRSAALRRWLARLAASEPTNPWIADLRDCAADLETAVAGAAVPAADAIDWIYESAGAHAREAPGHLNLLTAHGAKGREFDHVLVLDTGDWPSDQPDERRLLYVAMTRAKETLTLFQARQRGNPFLGGLEELEAVRRIETTDVPPPAADLDRIHRELTLSDIDLGFAGRSPSSAIVHRAILELQYGASLQLHDREFKDAHGRTIGKLAKKYELPAGAVLSARVIAVVRRTRSQSPEEYRAALKVEEWETVLAELVIQPGDQGTKR